MSYKKEKINRKTIVSICLILAISLLSCIFFTISSKAETVETPSSCVGKLCFNRPNDIAVANDGSFIVVVDSGSPSNPTIYLRKINVLSKDKEGEIIPLTQSSSATPLLRIAINQNNNKVLAYREPIQNEKTLVQIVDLNTKTVKELTSVSSQGIQISLPVFLDNEGKNLIAGTFSTNQPELLTIDAENDQIINQVPISAKAESTHISSQRKQVVLTHSTSPLSVSIIDENNKLSKVTLDSFLSSLIDDFQARLIFDIPENKAALSTVDGNHIAVLLDLKNKKLAGLTLDKTFEGPTISTISPDGTSLIAIGSILDGSTPAFKIYKVTISKEGLLTLVNSALIEDGSIVLDVAITPDQSKILILILKNDKKQMKVLSLKDLSKISEFVVSEDNDQSFVLIDPTGRFAVTPNTNIESSVSVITDFNLGPTLKSIVPNFAPINIEFPFTINGFFDLGRFLEDIKVCFRSTDFCATSVSISRNGQKLTGFTPKFPSSGFEDVLLVAQSSSSNAVQTTKYNGIFEFLKEGAALSDSTPPEITILAPKEGAFYNSRRVLVLGKVDGTGSEVDTKSILVNGKQPKISFEKSSFIISFVADPQFESDGTFEIKVSAKDKSGNTQEKTSKIIIDTLIPTISANVEATSSNNFKVTGTANGTGTKISSILVNNTKVSFEENETVNFTQETNTLPVLITAFDNAGNKSEITISSTQLEDKTPPQITVLSPESGQIVKDTDTISVSFTVTDDKKVNEVTLNSEILPLSPSNSYTQNINLSAGENLITIIATDLSGNKSSSSIKVTFIPEEISETKPPKEGGEPLQEKEVITLPTAVEDLNNTLIEEFSNLVTTGEKLIDISNTFSVEISNPPPIPEGEEAKVEVPELEGIEIIEVKEEEPEIPKGFSFGSEVTFMATTGIVTNVELKEDEPNTTLLIDSTGRTFIVGFAFFREITNAENIERKHKFQTTSGKPLELITTFTVPQDAQEGDAKISIVRKNESLATIKLKVAPQKDVKIKNKTISRPVIREPIKAVLGKSSTELTLKIKGKNFIGRSEALAIDGQLQKLAAKIPFTNVTFNPTSGIKIKKLKVKNNKLVLLKAKVQEGFIPGKVVFTVITPKGSDNGLITFPDPLIDGELEATANAEESILGRTEE